MPNWMRSVLTATLVTALCGAPEMAGALAQSQTEQQQQQTSAPPSTTSGSVDSQAVPQQTTSDNPDATSSAPTGKEQNIPDAPSSQTTQPKNDNPQQGNEPVGTAAAQAAKTRGGVASKPAGAAIAPAKQKRTRSLLIKLGLIAGAGVAAGTVYALQKGSPSRPPGAH